MSSSKIFRIIFTLMMICIIAASPFNDVYARKADDPIPVFDFVNGIEEEIQAIKYYNKDLSISGKALEGTSITICTYWYKPDNERSIIYKNKSRSEDSASGEWILQGDKKSCKVGISGIFGASVAVKPGKNKIVVETDSGVSYEMEVEYIKNEELMEKVNTMFFKTLDLELIH